MEEMYMSRTFTFVAAVVCLSFICSMLAGCLSGAGTGISVVKNLSGGKSYLRISLDGQQAKQNMLKKAIAGHSNWDVKEPVSSDNPVLSYKIINPDKLGRITYTAVNIYQEFKGDYSTQSEFTVIPKGNDPSNLMKENVTYDLGNPPSSLKVIDITGKDVKGVKLVPGMKYMLQLTIKADKSETANIHFKSK